MQVTPGAGVIQPTQDSVPRPPREGLLAAVRRVIRARHYSPRTEEAYVYWGRRYVRFHDLRYPSTLGEGDVARFLSHLAVRDRVAPATQNQALAALLFLYREVLRLPFLTPERVDRVKLAARVPVVLTRPEVRAVFGHFRGMPALAALLLYGSGLRLLECLHLRVKGVDFGAGAIVVRGGKGGKDRVTVLPAAAHRPLERHLDRVRRLHEHDVRRGGGRAPLPTPADFAPPAAGSAGGRRADA